MYTFKTFVSKTTIDEALAYHRENNIPLSECIFRLHSEAFYKFFREARYRYLNESFIPEDPFDQELLSTDIGEFDIYENEEVPLDIPLQEAEYDGKDVELNKPKRGGPKKFYVYVKNPKTGKVNKVTFGDTSGLKVKIDDPEARKSFAARHKCDQQNDKMSAAYWACRLPTYAKSLGLGSGGSFFW